MRSETLFLSLFCVVSVVAPSAGAQPAAPSAGTKTVLARPLAEAMTKKARELFSEGVQAVAQGRFADARAAFIGADALSPHYSNLCNLGDVETRLGSFVDAANHLRTCANGLDGDAKASPAEREAGKQFLDKARTNVVEIVITVNVDRAEVFVDGTSFGHAPLTRSVFALPGAMPVTASLDGYESAKVEIDGKAGVVLPVALTLQKKTVAPVASVTASVTPSVTPGTPPSGPRKEILIAGASGGGAALVAGVVLLGMGAASLADSKRQREDLVGAQGRRACETPGNAACKKVGDGLAEAQTFTNIGAALCVGAGAVAVGTMLYGVLARSTPAPTVQAGAMVGPQGGGLVLRGSF